MTTIGIVWDWVMGLVWPLVSDDGGVLVVGGGKTTWRLRCGVRMIQWTVVGCGYV